LALLYLPYEGECKVIVALVMQSVGGRLELIGNMQYPRFKASDAC
jgi:hypothetical protein